MKKTATSSTKENPSLLPESSSPEKIWTHTKVKVLEASNIWKISNFSFLCQKPFQVLTAKNNLATVNTKITWSLHQLQLNSDDNVVFMLWPSNIEGEVRAKYRLIIYDGTKKEVKVVSKRHIFNKNSLGTSVVMFSLNDIVSADKKILSNDELTIGWEVKFVSSIDTIPGRNCDPEFMNSKLPSSNTLELMFKNKKFSDIKINICDRMFEAHKGILAAASPVFLAMFESSMTEAERNYINIDDVDEETFEEMLRFIYTGNVNNIENIAYTLFAAADKYAIDELKNICENEMWKSLTADNAVSILILAHLHSAVELKEKVINFIKFERVDVTKKKEFESMINSHHDLVAEVMHALL